jgi:aminoglycoside N3'-acetyltransferase
MDEYASTRPDEMQSETRPGSPGTELSNKDKLRLEIEEIERRLEHKVARAKEALEETAEADRRDLERAEQKLTSIKETVKGGWDRVTETAAAALLKLLK